MLVRQRRVLLNLLIELLYPLSEYAEANFHSFHGTELLLYLVQALLVEVEVVRYFLFISALERLDV